ncbi:MAG: hypothetical protein ACI8WB_003316 [Phenylobacterium sp.]
MNYQPPQRDYLQMVRVIRDKANSAISFKLGNAYGANPHVSPTDLRIRTLNEMNLPSTSIRRPEPPAVDGFLPTRASSTLFHELNDSTQDYLNGQGGVQAVKRNDGQPGTKLRTELNKDAFSKKIFSQPSFAPQDNHLTKTAKSDDKAGQSSSSFTAFK